MEASKSLSAAPCLETLSANPSNSRASFFNSVALSIFSCACVNSSNFCSFVGAALARFTRFFASSWFLAASSSLSVAWFNAPFTTFSFFFFFFFLFFFFLLLLFLRSFFPPHFSFFFFFFSFFFFFFSNFKKKGKKKRRTL